MTRRQSTLARWPASTTSCPRRARRLFGLDGLLIRAGSGLIRRDMLRAVAARAERG
jgi:hypothetical protein